ncbi:MAG: LOG family protein, partial [Pseudomonadota bacterium]|nr:LOG family protein [Pseudomonadota bacterium]
GIGTLEELFEAWTWGQLGLHRKPCAIYNVNGFFDPLLAMVSTMEQAGFLSQQYIDMLVQTDQPESLHRAFQDYRGPGEKWT